MTDEDGSPGPEDFGMQVEENEGTPEAQGDPEDGDLFTFQDMKEQLGEIDDGEVAAWRQTASRGKPIIVQYGPPNSRRYELSSQS